MSNTKHITDQLSAYLDNRLSAAERTRVETHLRGCEQCRRDLAELGYTVNMVRALPVMRRPRSYMLAETPASPHWAVGWLYRAMGGATMAAALLLAVVLAADVLSFGASGAASPAPPVAMSAATRPGATGNAADSARAPEAPTQAAAPAFAQPTPTRPANAPAPTVVAQGAPTTAAAAPTASPQATGPSQPSTAGAISVTATATAVPTVTPSPTVTATIAPTHTPTATPSPHPTATSTPPAPPRAAATAQPAPSGAIPPARLVEFALAVIVLGGLGITLLLRALRPS